MDHEHDTPPREGAEFLKPGSDTPRKTEASPSQKRSALRYARCATTSPGTDSIRRQIAGIAAYCQANGLACDHDHHLFVDRNRSGSTIEGRASLRALLAEAATGHHAALVAEDLDHLSRDSGDLLAISTMMERLGIDIHLVRSGPWRHPRLGLAPPAD